MNQKILVAIVVLLVIGGAYWVYQQDGGESGSYYDTPASTYTTPVSPASLDMVVKGPLGIVSGPDGQYLSDLKGMTLYVNVKDEAQTGTIKASCNSDCERTWLPFLVETSDPQLTQSSDALLSKLNVFIRADGRAQYALGTKPLYRSANDVSPGDTKGAIGAEWMVAQP